MTERWLQFQGIEVGNEARTLAYLDYARRHGPTSVAGYNLWVGSIAECADIPGGPYVSPVADPAPWYTSSAPESGEFLGLAPTKIEILPILTRAARQRVAGGQTLTQLTPKGRSVQVTGNLYAMSSRGMEYGLRWLGAILYGSTHITFAGTQIQDLLNGPLGDLRLLTACPAGAASRFRTLVRSGCVDGPLPSAIAGVPEALGKTVSFQMGSEIGFLYSDSTTLNSGTLTTGTALCGVASFPDPTTQGTIRLTMVSGSSDLLNVTVTATQITHGGACPAGGSPVITFVIPRLIAGDTLVIDGAARTIRTQHGTLSALNTGGTPFMWIDIGSIDTCICMTPGTAGSGASGTIELIPREI